MCVRAIPARGMFGTAPQEMFVFGVLRLLLVAFLGPEKGRNERNSGGGGGEKSHEPHTNSQLCELSAYSESANHTVIFIVIPVL